MSGKVIMADEFQMPETNYSSVGRKLARRALKVFFSNRQHYMEECGCDEFNVRSKTCMGCLIAEVEGIMADLILKEFSLPDSRLNLPTSQAGRVQMEEAARDLIGRSLNRTLNNPSTYKANREAMITDPGEAYQAGRMTGQDAVEAVGRVDEFSDLSELIEKEMEGLAPAVHPLIQDYFDRGVQEVASAAFEPEIPSRKYRVARYESKLRYERVIRTAAEELVGDDRFVVAVQAALEDQLDIKTSIVRPQHNLVVLESENGLRLEFRNDWDQVPREEFHQALADAPLFGSSSPPFTSQVPVRVTITSNKIYGLSGYLPLARRQVLVRDPLFQPDAAIDQLVDEIPSYLEYLQETVPEYSLYAALAWESNPETTDEHRPEDWISMAEYRAPVLEEKIKELRQRLEQIIQLAAYPGNLPGKKNQTTYTLNSIGQIAGAIMGEVKLGRDRLTHVELGSKLEDISIDAQQIKDEIRYMLYALNNLTPEQFTQYYFEGEWPAWYEKQQELLWKEMPEETYTEEDPVGLRPPESEEEDY